MLWTITILTNFLSNLLRTRVSGSLRGDSSSIRPGRSCKKESLDPEILNLAFKTSELLNMSFCGVDIMHYKDKYYVIEVNSIPAWRGLQNVESENISDHFIDILLNKHD